MKKNDFNCYKCGSDNVSKNGYNKTKEGQIKQKYICKNCFSILTEKAKHYTSKEEMDFIKKAIKNEIETKDLSLLLNKTERCINLIIKKIK